MSRRTLVLPEANSDDRVAKAVKIIKEKSISDVLDINELTDKQIAECRETLIKLKKFKDLEDKEIDKIMKDELVLGALCLNIGLADGMIAGASHSTGDVLRTALRIIGVKEGVATASSCFLMKMPDGTELVFADCAVNPNPNSEALVEIALATADSAISLGLEPRIAMLSASTKGSAKYEDADKVAKATEVLKEENPGLVIEGEVQLDVALVPDVAKQKGVDAFAEQSANVLIFPDLDSGNIGYKLVERLAGAEAIGPILQGFNKPVNDLSRGCSVDDIVELAKITAKS